MRTLGRDSGLNRSFSVCNSLRVVETQWSPRISVVVINCQSVLTCYSTEQPEGRQRVQQYLAHLVFLRSSGFVVWISFRPFRLNVGVRLFSMEAGPFLKRHGLRAFEFLMLIHIGIERLT